MGECGVGVRHDTLGSPLFRGEEEGRKQGGSYEGVLGREQWLILGCTLIKYIFFFYTQGVQLSCNVLNTEDN